jgi:hypothetical protein
MMNASACVAAEFEKYGISRNLRRRRSEEAE